MNVFHIDNSNILGENIGGVVSYIRDSSLSNKSININFFYVGSGKPVFKNFIQVSKKIQSNFIYLIKLFFIQFNLPNSQDTIYHLHEAYMLLPFIFKSRSKFVLTFHGYKHKSIEEKRSFISFKAYEILTKLLLKKFDGIIANSDDIYRFYEKRYKIVSRKMAVIPVSIDTNEFKPLNKNDLRNKYNISQEDQIILFVGRIAYEKNLELLLDAFELSNTKYGKNYKLIIGGEGKHLEIIVKKIHQMSSSRNITLLGRLKIKEVVDYMNISDVFAITSLSEGGPIVLKEALACNLKIVSVPVGDAPELIPQFPGCKLSTYNSNDFAKSLINAIESYSQVDYSDKVKGFSKEFFHYRINEFYKSIIL